MVLLGRIELPTSSLPMTRSTTELQQRRSTAPASGAFRRPGLSTRCRGALLSSGASLVKRRLRFIGRGVIASAMSEERQARDTAQKQGREERLAAKLRENLRRRKAQARAVAAGASEDAVEAGPTESGGLPKSPPES